MPDTSLRFATAPVNWNNDDIPGWREPVPFPDLLDRMAEAGYTATEYDDKIGPDPAIVGVEANRRGIELCGFYQWVDLLDRQTLERQIPAIVAKLQQLGELGCRHLIIADKLRPERDAIAGRVPADGHASLDHLGYSTIAEAANDLALTARSFGFSTHYHNHVGTWVEAPFEVQALAHHLDGSAVDFCFDTGHFAYAGGNARHFIEHNLPFIGHLHLKDVDATVLSKAKSEATSFRDALRDLVFAPLGLGSAGIADIVSLLNRHSFPGWIVIEQDTCADDPTATARANLEFARNAAHSARTP